MAPYIRVTSIITSVLILAACAATAVAMKPKAGGSGAVAQKPGCLTQTGSRIAGDGTNCLAIGRTYTSDDISRTGATTAGDALSLMDPSITVHR